MNIGRSAKRLSLKFSLAEHRVDAVRGPGVTPPRFMAVRSETLISSQSSGSMSARRGYIASTPSPSTSADLLELLGSHQHITGLGHRINNVDRLFATFLDGLPELVRKIGRHGTLWVVDRVHPAYPYRSSTPSEMEC